MGGSSFDDFLRSIAGGTVTCTILVSYGKLFEDIAVYLVASVVTITMIIASFREDFYYSERIVERELITEIIGGQQPSHIGGKSSRPAIGVRAKSRLDAIPENPEESKTNFM